MRSGETARECDPVRRRAELTRAERTVGQIEHRREVDVDPFSPQGAAGRDTGCVSLRAARHGGSGRPGRNRRKRLDRAAFLIGEHERVRRSRIVDVPALHENTRGIACRR